MALIHNAKIAGGALDVPAAYTRVDHVGLTYYHYTAPNVARSPRLAVRTSTWTSEAACKSGTAQPIDVAEVLVDVDVRDLVYLKLKELPAFAEAVDA